MGLLGIPFPEEEGGAGLDTLAYAIAIEELLAGLGLARHHRRRAHEARLQSAPPRGHATSRRSGTSCRWRRARCSARTA